MAGISFNKSMSMAAMAGKSNNETTRLSLICPRAINKYINDPKELEGVIESIKKNGLISPITIVPIEDYLKSEGIENISIVEKEYYEKQLQQGRKYFVTTGHRRFYAYCSVCLGERINGPEDLDEFYKKFAIIEKQSDELIDSMQAEKANKYVSIKAYVVNDNFFRERERYNSSNLDQRALQDFETIDNSIDDMKLEGKFDEIINKFQKNKIAEMTDRQIKRTLENNNINKKYKTIDEGKELLKQVPVENLPGYMQSLIEAIKSYILEKRHKEIAETSIRYSLLIFKNLDDEIINDIYKGKINYNNARELQSFYPKLTDEEKTQIKNELNDGSFKIKAWKRSKVQKPEKVNISNRELLDYIKSVYKKEKTIDEVYEHLKRLNII